MRNLIITTLSSLLYLTGFTQSVTSSICTWKNDMPGAYNFIHDDYGDPGVDGIWKYADTIASNRGLKFTFGAITEQCENNRTINGYNTPYEYAKNVMMQQHGHEIMNHSHTHDCAVGRAGWNDGGTCDEPLGWGEDNTTQDFNKELVISNNSLISNTGFTPKYYIFPYDRFTNIANNKLKELGYIGSRTGFTSQANADSPAENPPYYRDGYDSYDEANFYPDADGFFRTAVVVDVPNNFSPASNLNYWVDQAIDNGIWVNREMHNVGSSGWGRIGITEYRNHLDYLKSKVDAGEVWVGTISEILTYQIQKLNYTPTANYNSNNDEITVTWNNPTFDVSGYLTPLVIKSPVTVKVDVTNLSGVNALSITQAGNVITDYTLDGLTLLANIYPHEGTLIIGNSTPCPTICISVHPQSVVINEGDNTTLSVIGNSNNAINYTWYKGSSPISGAPNSPSYTMTNTTVADNGDYFVELSNSLGTISSNVASVTIQSQTPFSGSPINIPGKIEFENFDLGGQGISYNETSPTNQSGYTYRNDGISVDIGQVNNKTVIGYTTAGEWLEYTLNIAEAGIYSFNFNTSSGNIGNNNESVVVYLDENLINSGLNLEPTGDWSTYSTTIHLGINLPAGIHTIRFVFSNGNFDYDYVEIQKDPVNAISNIGFTSESTVFPNPSKTLFNIRLNDNIQNAKYTVFDANGLNVTNGVINNQNTTIGEELEEGVYFLQIDNGSNQENIKIVKY